MRTSDILAGAAASLGRAKTRTALTVLGVAIGTATLVASVSCGTGVREAVENQFRKETRLRQITVYTGRQPGDQADGVPDAVLDVQGDMDAGRRERIKKRLARDWRQRNERRAAKPLTPDKLRELAAVDHVVGVLPDLAEFGRAAVAGKSLDASAHGAEQESAALRRRLLAGALFPAADARDVVVHEFFLYRAGVRDDAALRAPSAPSCAWN